eukprot:CAMPEP_0115235184 /NCGR_PEP_ID=MMETSP0270-20121206/35177_1 /TAXON_ID=71861 /ORGANISM="Scrippsiella trochoidea, Strain CCMP3099" /LENGTH=96 /DNA_ID=CAMNT_0002649953 /DNA_START=570 /DNA_END=859 /DNA_ORIENTATION=-
MAACVKSSSPVLGPPLQATPPSTLRLRRGTTWARDAALELRHGEKAKCNPPSAANANATRNAQAITKSARPWCSLDSENDSSANIPVKMQQGSNMA